MMKKSYLIYVILWVLLISCGKKQTPPKLSFGSEDYKSYAEEPTNLVSLQQSNNNNQTNGAADQSPNIPQQIYDIWSFSPQEINVPAQTTMGQAIYNACPNMRRCYDYNNVGGIKLIGEMSADKAGYNYSYYSYPIELHIPSLSQLHLCFVSSPTNIICQVLNGNVEIESAKIVSRTTGMGIEIETHNLSDVYQDVALAQGQMIEASDYHVQNVVISANATAQITPKGTWHCTLPVFCAAHHRSSPTGSAARITPYMMNSTASTFQSQQRVWDVLESEDDPNSYVTFYVWGKGTITSSGKPSPTGHAFVRIPQVGIIGFGSLHGGLLDDEGNIFDHTSKVKYVTDSCRIKVSDEAQKAMIRKLRQLQSDVPKYRIGRYDCTSFVMDIADAGGIHYGSRITIQTPVGFMQELKKHNYSY